jgi:GT2 family glycosyltransferase
MRKGDNLEASVPFGCTRSRNVLQRFVFPSQRHADRTQLFARWPHGQVQLSETDGTLSLAPEAPIDFNTWANALNHKKWQKLCALNDLALRVEGCGLVKLIVQEVSTIGAAVVLTERTVDLDAGTVEIEIGDPSTLASESVSLEVTALAPGAVLQSATWVTADANAGMAAVDGVQPWKLTKGHLQEWIVQRFILPDPARADRSALYARWPDGEIRLAGPSGMALSPNKRVDFATFFNAISHRKWHHATGLRDLTLGIDRWRRVRLRVHYLTASGRMHLWAEEVVNLSKGPGHVRLGDPGQIPGELLALEATGVDNETRISSAQWVTQDPPRRVVHMAAVITSFRRECAAQSAARRFSAEVIPGAMPGKMELFVIDNGGTLTLPEMAGVRLIQNRNLGGAGGFTRGLMEAQDSGDFTHALFMDDDASCEPESVWRCMALLSRVPDSRKCVSGAFLIADQPTWQYEKGAVMTTDPSDSRLWVALLSGRDLALKRNIARNDYDDTANYGGWWFFAFPLQAVRHLPFPFFVRGDDTDFCLVNDLPIITMNGIASWCDNFGHKLNPPTEYLAWRSWLALQFLHLGRAAQRRGLREALKHAILLGFRFDYAGMDAVLDGIATALRGPTAFGEAPAPLEALARTKARVNQLQVTGRELSEAMAVSSRQSSFWRLLAVLSLGGHLLPHQLLSSRLRYAAIAWSPDATSLVRASTVAYGQGRHVEGRRRDRKRFFAGLFRAVRIAATGISRLPAVAESYRHASSRYRTRAYWAAELGLEPEAPTTTNYAMEGM